MPFKDVFRTDAEVGRRQREPGDAALGACRPVRLASATRRRFDGPIVPDLSRRRPAGEARRPGRRHQRVDAGQPAFNPDPAGRRVPADHPAGRWCRGKPCTAVRPPTTGRRRPGLADLDDGRPDGDNGPLPGTGSNSHRRARWGLITVARSTSGGEDRRYLVLAPLLDSGMAVIGDEKFVTAGDSRVRVQPSTGRQPGRRSRRGRDRARLVRAPPRPSTVPRRPRPRLGGLGSSPSRCRHGPDDGRGAGRLSYLRRRGQPDRRSIRPYPIPTGATNPVSQQPRAPWVLQPLGETPRRGRPHRRRPAADWGGSCRTPTSPDRGPATQDALSGVRESHVEEPSVTTSRSSPGTPRPVR